MPDWFAISSTGVLVSCFVYSFASAVLPWVNCEILVLSLAAFAHSRLHLVTLVLITTVGQMVGKCLLYWAGCTTIRFRTHRMARALSIWKERLARSPSKPSAVVFVSSALGIPPFYLITVLAGALRVRFAPFLVVGTCGRLLRFGLLAFVPQLAIHLLHR